MQQSLIDREEKTEAAHRHPATAKKRLKLTREILASLDYEYADALSILERGSPLAGEIAASLVFQKAYKPCLTTLQQMEDLKGNAMSWL